MSRTHELLQFAAPLPAYCLAFIAQLRWTIGPDDARPPEALMLTACFWMLVAIYIRLSSRSSRT